MPALSCRPSPGKSYVLLDAARLQQRLHRAKVLNPNFSSLYEERRENGLSSVAPYLFTFGGATEFAEWFTESCWGDACGVVVHSQCSFEELHRHFQKLVIVKTEEGQELYFRFYDPRVLRLFLPTCDGRQLTEFFGPVERFICEDEDADYESVYSLQNNSLKNQRFLGSKTFRGNEAVTTQFR